MCVHCMADFTLFEFNFFVNYDLKQTNNQLIAYQNIKQFKSIIILLFTLHDVENQLSTSHHMLFLQ